MGDNQGKVAGEYSVSEDGSMNCMGVATFRKVGELRRDRRKFSRFLYDRSVLIEAKEENEVFKSALPVKNISAGGMFVQTRHILPIGTRTTQRITMTFEEVKNGLVSLTPIMINVSGRVCRISEGEGIAISFDEDYEITGGIFPSDEPGVRPS